VLDKNGMSMNKITNALPAVRLATTENLTTDIIGHPLTPAKLDGVTFTLETPGTSGDEILVKDQVDPSQNGTLGRRGRRAPPDDAPREHLRPRKRDSRFGGRPQRAHGVGSHRAGHDHR
jgi:hypothetical protein